MPERLIELNDGQKQVLKEIADFFLSDQPIISVDPQGIQECYNLSPSETLVVIGILYRISKAAGNGVRIDPKLKKQSMAALLNNPPGSRQLWEEDHGVYHIPSGRFPTGRNHSGRSRAQR